MYREIITPTSQEYMINIPKEYLDKEVEILVLPFSYYKKKKKKDLSQLLKIGVWDIKEEDVKVKDWKIQEF
ncbi:hypothetical protein GSY74_00330 [Sulfurovum sp. bin170]|uniref:hypothetical protein n=1 Tax=Sulfurovum sp. bin170 TaxID=2695268 RepID=UPI0013E082E7|nr:hypothetical protein [Sulfurovum sp. bin170]NEW59717.1 hypothetical protein [Sulfurovum sp. bin170]